ncbi:MAG TPA: YbhB/YbcL family Raf kinase inhibitor-like protein [Candidatus Binataceae bacterium]|nr:YbhB/YbcL family Raf kinase inhibitor-like protein [Candidatus Binataceae bacterium]
MPIRTFRCAALVATMLGISPAALRAADSTLVLTSPAFASGTAIPAQYSCKGGDESPALIWSGSRADVRSFALIVEDPDAPSSTFIHWVIFNLPGGATGIPAGVPATPSLPDGSTQGTNSFGSIGYRGPCPPPGQPHHYHFILFALDSTLGANSEADAGTVRSAMSGHVNASTELVGTFSR